MPPTTSNPPFVSVIIPTWNRKKVLSRAIESALGQCGVIVEVLICDDGSTDGTIELVRTWGDSRVSLLQGGHSGRPAIPRNRGIRAAKGQWIAFLDDDDEWLPGKLERQIAEAKTKKVLAVTTNAWRIHQSQPNRELFFPALPTPLFGFQTLLQTNYVITSAAMIHCSLCSAIGGFPEQKTMAHEDYAFWLRVSCLSPFAYIETPYVLYTDTPQTSIRGRNKRPDFVYKRRVCIDWLRWASQKKLRQNYLNIFLEIFLNTLAGQLLQRLYLKFFV